MQKSIVFIEARRESVRRGCEEGGGPPRWVPDQTQSEQDRIGTTWRSEAPGEGPGALLGPPREVILQQEHGGRRRDRDEKTDDDEAGGETVGRFHKQPGKKGFLAVKSAAKFTSLAVVGAENKNKIFHTLPWRRE